jgi:hypothetical protein
MFMKKRSMIVLSLCLLIFAGCSNNDDPIVSPISPSTVSTTLSSGNWRISYYWDSDHEETAHFNGYSFTFGNASSLTATNGATVVSGTWITGTDDSKTKLILGFTAPADFAELSDDWHVTEMSATRLKLEDVSGGGGGTDYLTFEKN